MPETPLPQAGISPELIALQRVVAGRYSIVRELGRGGMGIVFLARDAALERPVAIKLLPPLLALDPRHRTRFVREARMAAGLSHPHIVPIHAVEEHDDLAFFVMGYVDGETLAARVSKRGPLVIADAIRVTQEVAWALAHANRHGVIHRDIKPDNILLERESGRATVTDFGIARANDDTASSGAGTIVGTPRYMSPEQARGEPTDGRSDLYSLGAVAFYAVTGRAPIDGDSAAAILARKVMIEPPPLASVRGDVPPRFSSAVDRCLAKEPAARWASAEELAATLQSSGLVRDIPAPIRAFVREADRTGSEVATALTAAATSLAVVALLSATNRTTDFMKGLSLAIEVAAYLALAAGTAGIAGVRLARLVSNARGLLRSGYGHSAIRPALAAAGLAGGDEGEPAVSRAKQVGWMALGAGATMGSLLVAGMSGTAMPLLGIAGSVAIPTMVVRRLFEWRRGSSSLWSRLIRGSAGKLMFRIAGVGLDRRAPRLPAAGEPTSFALRNELTALFDALPASQRSELADLPALALRLESHAEALRDRTPSPESDRRLQSVVAALEMLRLDLLRLTAASADTSDLTRDFENARRLSDEIDARLRGNDEAARLLEPETP